MRKFLLLFCLIPFVTTAQQAPLLSRYQYVPAWFNPGLAGASQTPEVRALYRQQWLGLDGAPTTQMLYADLPSRLQGFGLNFNLTNDQAGALGHTDFRAAYAYRVRLGTDFSAQVGLAVNLNYWRTQWQKLTLQADDDPVFQNNFSSISPNFGAGAVLRYRRWQLGLGVPQVVTSRLTTENEFVKSRTTRLLYLHASNEIPLSNSALQLVPRLLVRLTSGLNGQQHAPSATDLGLGLRWKGNLEFSTSWRSALERSASSDDALTLSANWLIKNQLQLGATYEVPLTAIRGVSGGSVEVMAGYIFQNKKRPVATEVGSGPIPPPPVQNPSPATSDNPSDDVFACQVSGIIFDMTSGLPCESARVTLSNNCGQAAPKAFITGPDGLYKFRLKPGCCYTVKVEKDGFKPDTSAPQCPENVQRAQVFRADLDLRKG